MNRTVNRTVKSGLGILTLCCAPLLAQQIGAQDIEKILERADKVLEEAKAAYEEATAKSSVPKFIDAGFRLEEARIKYFVLQEIGSPEQQKTAADRLRAVNQLSKLVHEAKLVASGSSSAPAPSKPSEDRPPEKDSPQKAPAPAAPAMVDVTKRAAVPEAKAQQDAEKLIKNLFKEHYSKKTPTDRKALVRLLLSQAMKSQDDAAALWVLCREALDTATQLPDLGATMEAVDLTLRFFDVDGLQIRSNALSALGRAAKLPEDFASLGEAQLKLVDDLVSADQYDAAEKGANSALQFSRKSNDPLLVTRAANRTKEIVESKTLFQSMKNVLEIQAKNPDDPAANLEVGRFLCFVKGNWDLGLRFMVKGPDPALKALSEKELAATLQPAEQVTVADGWWALAEKEKSVLRKSQLFAHAKSLYETALPGVPSLVRATIEKRLEQLDKFEEPSTNGLVGRWLFSEASGTTAADSSGKGNTATLNGNITWVPGVSGSALRFDGSTGFVTAGTAGMPAFNAPQTLAWAYNVSTNPQGMQVMLALADEPRTTAVHPWLSGGKLQVPKCGGTTLVGAAAPSANEWHYVAYTYDGKTHKLYIDGVLKESSTLPQGGGLPKKLNFGNWCNGALFFSGILDEVRIYARVLNEGEIRSLVRRRK